MADETQSIQRIHWREVFPFVHVFRSFRVAAHPSKLLLGLLGLLILYAGGRILDGVWPSGHLAVPDEATLYQQHWLRADRPAGESFGATIESSRQRMAEEYADALMDAKIYADRPAAVEAAKSGKHLGELKGKLLFQRKLALDEATKARNAANQTADTGPADRRVEAKRQIADGYRQQVQQMYAATNERMKALEQRRPQGIFSTFLDYEVNQINGVVNGVLAWNWLGGLAIHSGEGVAAAGPQGVLQSVVDFLAVGPTWLASVHPLYFVLFAALFLFVWAAFGGAIARIAAVHVARDEKPAFGQALRFSMSKILSFVFAPIIPLLIVLIVGLVMSAGGLLFYIPFIGPIAAGLFFFLALIGGFIIALVLLGTIGGFNLMYPTIAVEGSDSFDAISRSFSYVFARPWRMAFYTAVAVAYGAITYLFVKFFAWLLLAVTHFFVGWWLRGQAAEYYPQIWPSPEFSRLPYDINFKALAFSEQVGAGFIAFWVFLLISLVGSYAISFYFSSNTIIYYLMRREVDATEMEDVYLEETDDEFAELPPATEAAAPPEATPVSDPPPQTPPPTDEPPSAVRA